jgi:hypothetical protein
MARIYWRILPVIRWVLDSLKVNNWWMIASNGNRDSHMDAGWDDALPDSKALSRSSARRHHWAPTGRIRNGRKA